MLSITRDFRIPISKKFHPVEKFLWASEVKKNVDIDNSQLASMEISQVVHWHVWNKNKTLLRKIHLVKIF